eukprot:7670264-Karenia_brevis.AAC.1
MAGKNEDLLQKVGKVVDVQISELRDEMGSHIGAVESNCMAANRSLADKVENVSEKAKHDNTVLLQKIEALEKKVEQVQDNHRSHDADI